MLSGCVHGTQYRPRACDLLACTPKYRGPAVDQGGILVNQIVPPRYALTVHPLPAVFLGGALALFLGVMLADFAYAKSFDIQWNNFASWLLVGGLVFGGIALVFAIIDLFRPRQRAAGAILYGAILLAAWLVGFFNALMHARDAWASMPTGLVLSAVTVVLAGAATWLGFRSPHIRGAV
ncbi:membrane protein, putative [Bordetella petrii]|uniref:Membrane protein, putative n=1 Tax=Bordetella petrii (strain ATCC BAA-461 / DSM 12804 / CCUG 43448 / CIP 107267 / Se-1111R) TaxID=340100 RepID=A9IF98_BORPD|nr:membrane protein, putative [Bordetella petrii]